MLFVKDLTTLFVVRNSLGSASWQRLWQRKANFADQLKGRKGPPEDFEGPQTTKKHKTPSHWVSFWITAKALICTTISNCLSVEQEVGGSSPPNCTTTNELPRISSNLLIDLTYLRHVKYKGAYKWHYEWSH
jgi:hypothetical protein